MTKFENYDHEQTMAMIHRRAEKIFELLDQEISNETRELIPAISLVTAHLIARRAMSLEHAMHVVAEFHSMLETMVTIDYNRGATAREQSDKWPER
jgi:hypothetical protein